MADAAWWAGGRSAAGPPCLDPSRIPRDLSITVMPPTPAHTPIVMPAKGDLCITVIPAKAGIQGEGSQVGGNCFTLPTSPSQGVTQRSPKAGIQGGGAARGSVAPHPPPSSPRYPRRVLATLPLTRPSRQRPGDCHRPIARTPQVPYHPSNTPTRGGPCPTDTPHPPSFPRRRESRVGRGPAQPITYPPPPRNPPPTWPSRQRPAKAGIQGGGRLALPPQSRRAATRVKPRRRCQGGLPPKNNQRAKPCRSYRESPPSKQSTLCVPSRFRRRKKKDRLSTEL